MQYVKYKYKRFSIKCSKKYSKAKPEQSNREGSNPRQWQVHKEERINKWDFHRKKVRASRILRIKCFQSCNKRKLICEDGYVHNIVENTFKNSSEQKNF